MPQTAALDDIYCPSTEIQKYIRLRYIYWWHEKGKAVDKFVYKFMTAM